MILNPLIKILLIGFAGSDLQNNLNQFFVRIG